MDSDDRIFEELYEQWQTYCQRDEVALNSSDDAYINNPYFEAIVRMGNAAVPHIMAKLRTDESAHFLIHALERITHHRFSPQDVEAAGGRPGASLGNQGYAALWLDWWDRQRGEE